MSVKQAIDALHASVEAASAALQRTSAPAAIQSVDGTAASIEASRAQLQSATSRVKSGEMRSGLRRRLAMRRVLPWRWGTPPGISVGTQLGAAARLPLNGPALLQRVRSAPTLQTGRGSGGQPQSLPRSLAAPIMPIVRSTHMQPVARLRGEATLGHFRGWLLDHTSATCDLELALRQPAALGAWEFGSRGSERSGVRHMLAAGVRQQVLGPVRACADMRWELSADGGPSGEGAKGERAATPAFGSNTVCHVANLRPHRVDSVFGVDWAVGPASVVAWYSPLRRQGLLEVRL